VDVTVLTTDLTGRLPTSEKREGFEIRRFPAYPRSADLRISPALSREVSSGSYDVVHVQGIHTFVPPLALKAARRAGRPSIVTFHTGGHSSRLRTVGRQAQWRALGPSLRRASALVAVSAYEAELFARILKVPPARIRVIRNGAQALPVGGAEPEVSGSPLICSVGRLERYKGHNRVIAAMPALLAVRPGAHLVVIGRGSYEPQLRRLVARLGVEAAVTFTAFDAADRPELGALLQSCDVVALLSDYEAHPVAVVEALALGRKVVVAATSGLTELAHEGLVTAVAPDARPEVVAEVLARVAAEPEATAPRLPSWDECVDDLLRLYEDLRVRRS
jgi:glycosyltransferase involved in cell wall biosynthesis